MAKDEGQEKTHEPTAKRRKDFREKGQVPRSQEVTATAGLIFGAGLLLMTLPMMGERLQDIFMTAFGHLGSGEMTISDAENIFSFAVMEVAWMVGPMLVGLWVASWLVGLIQGRLAIPKEPIKFQLEKLNPVTQFKEKYFSSAPFVDLAKGLIKLFLIGWLVWVAIEDRLGLFPSLMTQTPGEILRTYEEIGWIVLTRAVPVAVIVSVLDYAYQWYKTREEMMMTRQEVKEEQKQSEGDPHMKQARRQRAMQIAMAQTVRNVAKADVVITNPTHYAVILRYNKDEAPAPVVIGKGIDHLAQRIKAEALRLDIPMVENRPLARALHAQCKEGEMIPEDLYGAVAKILALIWKRRGRTRIG
jgi:flagellar biosynthetic protein FlhB